MTARYLGAIAPILLCLACSGKDASRNTEPLADGGAGGNGAGGNGAGACSSGMVLEGDQCVDPVHRYEPDERVDFNNTVSYGGGVLTLDLPDPPKSGFRLVVPPRDLEPGDEVNGCHAWAYPELQNRNVYAARVFTSGSLHHSNMYGVPIAPTGRSDYPACAPGQGSVFTQVPNFLTGNIMDVLFANSTQIDGGEQIVFTRGMAFKITTEGREVATSIHWLNPTGETVTSEIVYDFFTMPDDQVETEIVPFVFENQGFEVPAQTKGNITTTCSIDGTGNIVTIMPHTHKRAVSFDVELLRADGTSESIFHDGAFDTESEITVLDQPIPLGGFSQIRHTCVIDNDLTRPIVWGIGDDEMCTLFGYMYPPSTQQIGYVGNRDPNTPSVEPGCLPLAIGQYRK